MQSVDYDKRCLYIYSGNNYELFHRFREYTRNQFRSDHVDDRNLVTYNGRVCYTEGATDAYIEFDTVEDLVYFKLVFS